MLQTIKYMAASKRMWMHTPVGLCFVALAKWEPLVGLGWWCGFLLYECWQCYRIGDNAHEDISGGLVGTVLTFLVLAAFGKV